MLNQREGWNDAQTSSYRQALNAWNRGDHDATLRIIEPLPTNLQSSESLLLCARALIHKDRLSDAREWLVRTVSSHRTADIQATQLMLQAMIEVRERNTPGAEALFARALEVKAHHTIRSEINYERAFAQYLARRYDDARATLRRIRPYSDIVYVRAIALEGWIDAAAGEYRSACAAFGAALMELDKCARVDTRLRASLLCEFSMLSAELDQDPGPRLLTEFARISWDQGLVREQVQTLRYIGLVHRRAGRANDAMGVFGDASAVAPGSPWQILGVAECACLCVDRDDPVVLVVI